MGAETGEHRTEEDEEATSLHKEGEAPLIVHRACNVSAHDEEKALRRAHLLDPRCGGPVVGQQAVLVEDRVGHWIQAIRDTNIVVEIEEEFIHQRLILTRPHELKNGKKDGSALQSCKESAVLLCCLPCPACRHYRGTETSKSLAMGLIIETEYSPHIPHISGMMSKARMSYCLGTQLKIQILFIPTHGASTCSECRM